METLDDVLAEASEVFGFSKEVRPQDRAHAYLARHKVRRGYDDTAMECACVDMVRRGFAAGARESLPPGAISNLGEAYAAMGKAIEAIEGAR